MASYFLSFKIKSSLNGVKIISTSTENVIAMAFFFVIILIIPIEKYLLDLPKDLDEILTEFKTESGIERLETVDTAQRTFLRDFMIGGIVGIVEKNNEPRLFIPVTIEGENSADIMLPADSLAVNALFTAAEDLGRDPSDLLEESIVKLFKVAFDIDIKTCTKKEWAERITIKGGALKQWQSFIKLPPKRRISQKA
ncbi:MAG: hypothetical protein P4L49_17665 [Desulfosporosinus sp.]|nr:hypothetical protein [Desulfosporosinus sp.]